MFLSCIWIRLVTLQCVQSQEKVDAEELKNHFFSFEYESHQIQFVFFLLPLGPNSGDSQILQNPEASPNHQHHEIEPSESTFECSALLETFKITRNSIILKASNQTRSKLLYFECSSPLPNILGYFLIDNSIDLESNKDLQYSIINFLTKIPQVNDKIKRNLQLVTYFNDLVFEKNGCVPCAINEFDYLNSSTPEDLGIMYLMLLNYNEAILGKKFEYKLNYACKMNPTFQALYKLLSTNNFRQAETICQKYYDNTCLADEDILKSNFCEIELEVMIKTHLDFFNLCFAKYFYKRFDGYVNYDNNNILDDYSRIWKRISVLIYEFNQLGDFNYTTPFEENGLQIKLSYTMHDCNTLATGTYLKDNFCFSRFIFDSIIIFVKYCEFGDYAFRFTYEESSISNILNWCQYEFRNYYYSHMALNQCGDYLPLEIYYKNSLFNIHFIYFFPCLFDIHNGRIDASLNVTEIYLLCNHLD